MKISLIISTYNRPDMLELVLKSLARQKLGALLMPDRVEVLIADDGSSIDTARLIAKYQDGFSFRLTHIWHEDDGFRAAAIRNLTVSKSNGEYLLFIDGDCLLAPDFIYNQFLLAEAGYFVAGNRVLLSKNYTTQILNSQDISVVNAGFGESIALVIARKINKFTASLRLNYQARWRKTNETRWQRPKGCNVGIWRHDFLAVNGFDESFSGWGHEDADLFVRLLHAGIRIKDGRFAAPVYHLWHKINDRSKESDNKQRLLARVNNHAIIRAVDGVDKYLDK